MLAYRTNNFNFIRLALALMVLVSHAPELIDGNRQRELFSVMFRQNFSFGKIAVAGFFILSGYLISKSWLSNPDAIQFMNKRVRRIYPGFIVASVVCALIVGPLGAASVQTYFTGFHPLAFVFGTLFLRLPVIPPVFAGTPYSIVNGAMWTIPIEFACYLGVLALGFIGGLKRTFCLIVTLALLGLCAFEKLFVHQLGFISHFSLDLAAYFSVGCCFYIFRDAIRFTNAIAALSGLVLFFCLFSFRLHQLAFSLCGAYLLFYLAFAKIRPLESFNQLPDVSYGVYLYGWPIQKLIIWWFPACSPWLLFFVSAVAAIAAGWASWNLVEKRFMLPKRPATLPASAAAKENLAKPALNAE